MIACVSCASTFVFCVSVIVPIYEKKNINTIGDLEAKLATLDSSHNQKNETIEKLKSSIALLSEEITEKNEKILQLREEERFSNESPFPKGFRDISILQPFERVKEIHKTATQAKSGYMDVQIEDKLFKSATYYRLECQGQHRVSHVLFMFNDLISMALKDKSKPMPKYEEAEEDNKKTALVLINIFREKYGQEVGASEDDEYFFEIKNTWIARISPKGLLILSILNSEKLNQACTHLNAKNSKKPST